MATSDSQPRLPGSLFISDDRADLRRGFQHLTHDFTSGTAFTDVSLAEAAQGMAPLTSEGWQFKVDVTGTERELMQSLDLSVSGEATLWGTNVRGAASWVKDVAFKEETVIVVVAARNVMAISPFDGSKLQMSDDAKGLMKTGGDEAFRQFYRKYGSYFVGKVWRGGELNLVFRRDFSSRQEKEAASADLRAAGISWSAEASATAKKSGVLDRYEMTAQGYGVGGDPAISFENMTAEKVLNWALGTWMASVDEKTAGTLLLEMMNMWTTPDGNPDYADYLAGPEASYRALADALLRLDGLAARVDYCLRDVEHCAPTQAQLGTLQALKNEIGAARNTLADQGGDGLSLEPQATLMEGNPLDGWEQTIAGIEGELVWRRPIANADRFRLRTTGENNYYLAGPRNNMGPSMSLNAADAEPLKFDGAEPKVGAEIRLHSLRGIEDRHIVTAVGRNDWLQYKRGVDKKRTWKIEAKRDGGDAFIRHGDRLRVTNCNYPDMTIKAEAKDGQYWGKAKHFRNHWLLIERMEAPALGVDEPIVPAEDPAEGLAFSTGKDRSRLSRE